MSERSERDFYSGVQMEIYDYGTYVYEARVSVCMYILRSSGMNQNDAMTHWHVYVHGFITKLFLKQFCSNRVRCHFKRGQLPIRDNHYRNQHNF